MDDRDIVKLYFDRDESAIELTKQKYGKLCRSVAYGILRNDEDAEECVSDALLSVWNSVPPAKPEKLGAYAAKIVRNSALSKKRSLSSEKRGGGETAAVLDELEECIPDRTTEAEEESRELARALDFFLSSLKKDERVIFVKRYWGMEKICEIASETGFSESKIKTSLLRTREKLRLYLKKEEIQI